MRNQFLYLQQGRAVHAMVIELLCSPALLYPCDLVIGQLYLRSLQTQPNRMIITEKELLPFIELYYIPGDFRDIYPINAYNLSSR